MTRRTMDFIVKDIVAVICIGDLVYLTAISKKYPRSVAGFDDKLFPNFIKTKCIWQIVIELFSEHSKHKKAIQV